MPLKTSFIPISPIARYRLDTSLVADKSQIDALNELDSLYQKLLLAKKHNDIKGVYLWGKVGRGKTYLMDIFYQSLMQNLSIKSQGGHQKFALRQHFHHFMADIHKQLNALSGTPNPLKTIAHDISLQYRVICFDEFFVSDIGDAMLLGRLFQFLFKYQVILVTTSNIAPEDLYKNGLQRARFLPAIDAIRSNTKTLHLDGLHDHRKRHLEYHQIYFLLSDTISNSSEAASPETGETQEKNIHSGLLKRFKLRKQTSQHELILGRKIPIIARNHDVICFQFYALCEGSRSHLDYIEIAHRYKTLLLLNIPPLSGKCYEHITARGTEDGSIGSGIIGERAVVYANTDDATRRFIALVDELYDQKIVLYLTSPIPLDQLYTEGSLLAEFQRTQSRLSEMASLEYLQASSKKIEKLTKET